MEQNIRLDQKARVAEEVVLAKPAHGEQMLKATLAPQTTTLKKTHHVAMLDYIDQLGSTL